MRWDFKWIFVFVPFLIPIALVYVYAVPVVFWDEWELVHILREYFSGTLAVGDLFGFDYAPLINEHHPFFPRLILLGLALLTGWNLYAEIVFNLIISFLSFFLLARLVYMRLTALPETSRFFVSLLFSFIFFSPLQWENWIWGWQLSMFLTVFCLVASLYVVSVPSKGFFAALRITLAIVLAAVGSYSFGNGLVIWPAVGIAILFRFRLSYFLVWSAAALVVMGGYFYGYNSLLIDPSGSSFLQHLGEYFWYVFSYLGASILPHPQFAPYVGGILLILFFGFSGFIYFSSRSRWISLVEWFSLGIFSIISALLTAAARWHFDAPLSGRYVTMSQFLLFSCVILGFSCYYLYLHNFISPLFRKFVAIFLSLIFIVIFAVGSAGVLGPLRDRNAQLIRGSECIDVYYSTSDASGCIGVLYPDHDISDRIDFLTELGWAGFTRK